MRLWVFEGGLFSVTGCQNIYMHQPVGASLMEFKGNTADRGGGALFLDCLWTSDQQDITQTWSRYLSRCVPQASTVSTP